MSYWIKNTWYVAMAADALAAGAFESRLVLGERLLLVRDAEGHAHALEDRCPHRGAPLSLGRITEAGAVRCGYHGLEFDLKGSCIRNPHGNGSIPSGCKVRAYPLVERYGMLWVWMGMEDADLSKLPRFDELEPTDGRERSRVDFVRMPVPYEYIVDNLLDLSHVSFLHDGVLGNEDTVSANTDVVQEGNAVTVSRWTPGVRPPEYFDLIFRQDGQRVDMWQNIRWEPPSNLLLDVGVTTAGGERAQGTSNIAGHFLTPETETSTIYHFTAVPRNPVPRSPEERARVAKRLGELRQLAFAGQDEPMIRAQYENIVRAGPRMSQHLLSIDVGAVRWRRVMDRLIAHEQPPELDSPPA